ncbi:long chronological lifespan protein 2 [Ephemerocybe angulata]|uniref:Long chronological lifespan protein 2 n=1 Tax=Ephemerocybe angulata TaxID=980116 RepID=A0A8H6ICW9_9AGAR|nr:long chronological lifespan protein 2 [Tulosesus angulatus]
MSKRSVVFIVSLLFGLASAQFQFFGDFFGHQQQQQQQQRSGSSQWATFSESVECSQYLCPGTLACVSRPSECPCPDPQDVKCLIPAGPDSHDAAVLCVRGSTGCAQVERLTKKGV